MEIKVSNDEKETLDSFVASSDDDFSELYKSSQLKLTGFGVNKSEALRNLKIIAIRTQLEIEKMINKIDSDMKI